MSPPRKPDRGDGVFELVKTPSDVTDSQNLAT